MACARPRAELRCSSDPATFHNPLPEIRFPMPLSPFPDFDLGPLNATLAEMRKGAEFLASGINNGELREIADHLTRALAEQEADFLAKVPGGIAAGQKEYEGMQKEYDAMAAELNAIENQKRDLVAKMGETAKTKPPKLPKALALKPTLLPSALPPPELNPSPDLLKELLNLGKKESNQPINKGMRVSGNIWDNWPPADPQKR